VHVHCRTGTGHPDYRAESYKQTLDFIFDSCPDIIAMPTTAHGDSREVKNLVDTILGYGKKYIRSTILLEANMDLATHLEDNHIKPEFTCRSLEDLRTVDELLVKPGLVNPRYFLTVSPGMKGSGYTHVEPWSSLGFINMRYSLPPDSIVSVSTGGRNWLGLANLAILLGAEILRIGMEDTTWLYPDGDELLPGNAHAVKKVAAIAKELGREIATPQDAVRALGLT